MTRQSPHGQEDPGRNPEPVTAETDRAGTPGEAGEPACWAHLVCPTCGAMVSEGHRRGCQSGGL
jgi:hypothetical protein